MTNGAKKGERAIDIELDEALEDSFPASDPPALTNPSSFTGAEAPGEKAQDRASEKLDEQLEETFPASDTPTALRKQGTKDK